MDRMKDYRQLLKELPPTTLVCAFGEFDPPTTGHELLVKTVKRLAEQNRSDHVIFTSPSKSLTEEKKEHYLNLMFPKAKFVSMNESKISTIKKLNEKYKKIVVVTGSEQVNELKKIAGIEVITINEKSPDVDKAKMKQLATKGIYEEFKKKLPSTMRELDARRLMNDVRTGLGLEAVKEEIVLVKDVLREMYFRGEIFNEGDLVESGGQQYTIAKRGSNHLLLKEKSGELVSKWLHDVKLVESHTLVTHNKNHKELSHGSDFSMKVGKEHHGKIKGLQHGDQHEFKCMDGNEWGVQRRGDDLHFAAHKLDTNISSNSTFHVPLTHFTGEEEPESEDTKQIKSFSQMLIDKSASGEHLTPQERTLLRLITKSGDGKTEISEAIIQSNGTDKIDNNAPESASQNEAPAPKGKKKGFLTFYNADTKDNNDFKVAKMESVSKEQLAKETKAVKKLKSFKDMTGNGNANPAGGSGSNVSAATCGCPAAGGAGISGVDEHIEKVGGGYEVESEHGNKNLGKSKTLAGAKKRLAQVEYFKHMKESEEKHELGIDHDEPISRREHIMNTIKKHGGKISGQSDKSTYVHFSKDKVHAAKAELQSGRVHASHWINGELHENIQEEREDEAADRKKQLKRFKAQILPQQVEESYDVAEKHLGLADKAQRNKDMFSHHMHMADYHDSLSQWHDSKGRSAAAEKHADKAAGHEETAHAIKARTTVKESRGHKLAGKYLKKTPCPTCGQSPCVCDQTQDRSGISTENKPNIDPFFQQ